VVQTPDPKHVGAGYSLAIHLVFVDSKHIFYSIYILISDNIEAILVASALNFILIFLTVRCTRCLPKEC
jgi:hypothetical protein